MKAKVFAGAALAAMLGLALPARPADTATIAETVAAMKEHSVLALAIKESGQTEPLRAPGPYTLFAPTDAAFKKLDDETIKKVVGDKEMLKNLMRAHVVEGKLTATELRKPAGKGLKSLGGTPLVAEDTKDGLKVNGAKLVATDVVCSNGVIHVIDAVLVPR